MKRLRLITIGAIILIVLVRGFTHDFERLRPKRLTPAQELMYYMSWHCPELRNKSIGSLSSNELVQLDNCRLLGY